MFKKTMTYTDVNGNERTEDFYFNLTKAELAEWELTCPGGGLAHKIDQIVASNNQAEIIKLFKEIVLKAYGEKSEDGRRFIKNDQLREEFSQTEAYSELFMEFITDMDSAVNFINGIIPKIDAPSQVTKSEVQSPIKSE